MRKNFWKRGKEEFHTEFRIVNFKFANHVTTRVKRTFIFRFLV